MLALQDIRDDLKLINEIDWEMTPEKAVSLYLEWGNNWNHGIKMVRSKDEAAYYFVVYSWEDGPRVHLVRRDGNGAEELAIIDLPPEVSERFLHEWGGHKGTYALTQDVESWLKDELGVNDTVH